MEGLHFESFSDTLHKNRFFLHVRLEVLFADDSEVCFWASALGNRFWLKNYFQNQIFTDVKILIISVLVFPDFC